MKKPSLLIALLLVASVAAAPMPSIQQLQSGKWTGTATPPDGMTAALVYTVASTEDGMSITIEVPEMGISFATEEPKLEGETLTFGFSVENDVLDCSLERQDDGYFSGSCVDQDGGVGYLVMNPPGSGA